MSSNFASSSSAAAMEVTFVDAQGPKSIVQGATGASIVQKVFHPHPLLRTYENIAKNAFNGLISAATKVQEIVDSKPGFLHSLDIKKQVSISPAIFADLNQMIHAALIEPASKISLDKV